MKTIFAFKMLIRRIISPLHVLRHMSLPTTSGHLLQKALLEREPTQICPLAILSCERMDEVMAQILMVMVTRNGGLAPLPMGASKIYTTWSVQPELLPDGFGHSETKKTPHTVLFACCIET